MADTLFALPVDPKYPPVSAQSVSALDVSSFEVGVSRVFIELVGDGLGAGVRVPVLVARGVQPGPVLGITACLHGNELNGIPVIHRVFDALDVQQLKGTVVGVVALNVYGVHLNQREFIDGTDLNRIMPGHPQGSAAQVYASRILDRIVNQFNYLMDLHTASFGRINSLYIRADMKHETCAAFSYLQDAEIIVHNEASKPTLRGAAMRMGIPAITVEIGDPQTWQSSLTRSAVRGVRAVLDHLDMFPLETRDLTRSTPVLCRSSSWMYTDRGGLLDVRPGLCDVVSAGQHVATVRTAFGDVIREYNAPTDGIVVGRSVNPVGPTGARILHLGLIAHEGDGLLTPSQAGLH